MIYDSMRYFTLILSIIVFQGCRPRHSNEEVEFSIVAQAIEKLFEIQLPQEVTKIIAYRGAWQDRSLNVYFEIPAENLLSVKTDAYDWQEIPEEYRSMISNDPSGQNEVKDEKWISSISKANSFFHIAKSLYNIHDNVSEKIQWFYYSESSKTKRPEEAILLMISESQNGTVRCYLSNRDISGYEELQEFYMILAPGKSITFCTTLCK